MEFPSLSQYEQAGNEINISSVWEQWELGRFKLKLNMGRMKCFKKRVLTDLLVLNLLYQKSCRFFIILRTSVNKFRTMF